jgi:hypothetical protein
MIMTRAVLFGVLLGLLACAAWTDAITAQEAKKAKKKTVEPEVTYPPKLPDDRTVVTDTSEEFLKPPGKLLDGVLIAKTAPTVDFAYVPGQTYAGNPWSVWGDSLAAGGKYYFSFGDHWSVDSRNALKKPGNGFVFEYDPTAKTFRKMLDLRELLQLADGHYSPGKIHSRLDIGDDGWIYCSTHRGSTRVTVDQYHYKGDWIVRFHPATGKSEAVVCGPVPKHCIPNSVLDPKRLIYYGGTAPGTGGEDDGVQFFAYDCKNNKLLYAGADGPARYMIFAASSGRVYYVPKAGESPIMRFDPEVGKPVEIPGRIGIRAATQETPQGIVYTASLGQGGRQALIYAFNTKTETVDSLGPLAVGSQNYVASLDADPTGRYLYYVAGAHGGSEADGTPIVQFDVKTRTRKVLAFLHPFYKNKYGATIRGTYATAVDPKGDKLYITWNINRSSRAWDTVGITVIHIPESERTP